MRKKISLWILDTLGSIGTLLVLKTLYEDLY
jgi:hypothetical protein